MEWGAVQPDWAEQTTRTPERRVGDGLWGAAVPSHWEIADAEMYAILRYLRSVVAEDERETGTTLRQRRVLVMSDCKPAMQQIE